MEPVPIVRYRTISPTHSLQASAAERDVCSRPSLESTNMPRYFFHVVDGRATMDREGTELTGLDEARTEAVRMAGEMLRYSAENVWTGCPWQMTVADADGKTLFTLRFSAHEHAHST